MFKGSMVALVTPFDETSEIDYSALNTLLDTHIEAKTDAIIIAGTTGEAATLTRAEKLQLFKHSVEYVNGKVPIIAGAATSSTKETIMLCQAAASCGVNGLLVMTPAYNKPTQHGLIAHYQAIANAVDIPIILYNVPGRTACDMLPATVIALSEISNIVAVKEASGDVSRVSLIVNEAKGEMAVFSGEDALTVDMMEAGAMGTISVTANVYPKELKAICDAALSNDFQRAKSLDSELQAVHQALFVESNPIPVKWLVAKKHLISDYVRLPLTPLSQKYHATLAEFI